MITSTHTTYLYEYLATEAKNRIFVSINKIVWCSIFEWYIEEIKLTYVNIFLPVVFISNYYTRGHNMIIYIFFFSFCLGAIHKWRQIYRGRGVSENLMLINKISKFYTIKVWQGGVQNPRKRPDVMMAPYVDFLIFEVTIRTLPLNHFSQKVCVYSIKQLLYQYT